MKLDATKKPREIDEKITTGPKKGKIFLAIYEIDDEQQDLFCCRWQGPAHVVFLWQWADPPGLEAGEEMGATAMPTAVFRDYRRVLGHFGVLIV